MAVEKETAALSVAGIPAVVPLIVAVPAVVLQTAAAQLAALSSAVAPPLVLFFSLEAED